MILLLLASLLAIPRGLDLYLPIPEGNPVTAEKIELGRRLFNDRRLSRDESRSCASCHDPAKAFSDGRRVAIGVFKRAGRRSAPAIINRVYGKSFFWDGRITTLEEQVLRPIQDRNEMDLTLEEASARVGLTAGEISQALATYVRSILSGDAPFDRFAAGDRAALSAAQQRGLALFRGKAHCTVCHLGATFTDERYHNTGVAWREPPPGSREPGRLTDDGRFIVTGQTADLGAFKTPTLREVARTAPYMHDGSFATLNDVVDFYNRGARRNPGIDPELRPLHLTNSERHDLVSFLRALSGRVSN